VTSEAQRYQDYENLVCAVAAKILRDQKYIGFRGVTTIPIPGLLRAGFSVEEAAIEVARKTQEEDLKVSLV